MSSGDRTALARFGGGRRWSLPDGTKLDVGEVITSAGEGKGVALLPWALYQYGRTLRLRPEDRDVLAAMLAHVWTADGAAYLSIHKLERTVVTTRNRVKRIFARLEELGYIVRLPPKKGDQRRYYSVKPLYDALALCIACDPKSDWANEYGVLSPDVARGLRGSDGARFDLDLETLAQRQNGHAVEELSWE